MKENFELIEYGVLMEAEKNGKDLSVIDWPVNCNERQFAEQLLADELKRNPWKAVERTTEAGVKIKELRIVKKTTTVVYE